MYSCLRLQCLLCNPMICIPCVSPVNVSDILPYVYMHMTLALYPLYTTPYALRYSSDPMIVCLCIWPYALYPLYVTLCFPLCMLCMCLWYSVRYMCNTLCLAFLVCDPMPCIPCLYASYIQAYVYMHMTRCIVSLIYDPMPCIPSISLWS